MNNHNRSSEKDNKIFNILTIFSYLGGALIFFGIAFFIELNWNTLSNFSKIFSTLGSAIAAYTIGMLLNKDKDCQRLSSVFFMITGLMLPLGLDITYEILGWHFTPAYTALNLSGLCLSIFLLSHLLVPRTVFLFFIVIFASLFYISSINYLLNFSSTHFTNITEYEMTSLGLSYICFGYYLTDNKTFSLCGPLYFFGALFFLGSLYSLGGFYFLGDSDHLIWKSLSAISIILSFVLAVPLKSKSFLYLGAIFFILYMTDMSAHFSKIFGNFGWPLILVVMGFLIIFLGYILLSLHKRIHQEE